MPEEFEDGFGDALRRTADTFRPDDPSSLVTAGHLRGRRLRRRRTVTVVAGAAAFAAVAVGGVLAGGLVQGGGHTSGVAAAPEQPKQPAPVAKATTAPPVSGEQVAAIFRSLLPKGTVTGLTGTGTEDGDGPEDYASATAVFNDGRGPAQVMVFVQRQSAGVPSCPPRAQNPGTWCSITHVHGGTLMLFKAYEYPDHRRNLKDWDAMFVTSDGSQIEFSQWNAKEEKAASTSRANPPLNLSQMTSVVTSKAWGPVLAALPDPVTPPKGSTPDKSALDAKKGVRASGVGYVTTIG